MTEEKILTELKNQAFFQNLDEEFLRFLARSARPRDVAKGDVLFKQGDWADAFYLLRDGEVLIEIPSISGPSLEIQRLREGQILGWSWLIAPYKWTFQARAEDDTHLLEFDGAAILTHCEEDPSFGYALLKRFSGLMSERLEAARRRMMDEWNPPGFA